ncbi:MAG: ATP-binding cassette domain-containing protein, partial [Candidatus Zixiibacteriota bacterium]
VKSDQSKTTIKMTSSGRSFALVLSVKEAVLGYGGDTVLENINFDLYRGDKAALLGRNGSGKTTLLRALIGELAPITGEINIGSKVEVAYFDQELENLNGELTVLESAWQLDPNVEAGVIRSYLGRFGFTGEEQLNKVSSLSGGEKTKLSLALLLYHPANFIILDEPTNHLDIDSREALEEALLKYDGSCLIVSHDRYFLDRIANRILHIADGRLRTFNGNYSYFKEKSSEMAPVKVKKESGSKSGFYEFKEKSKRAARHERAIKTTREKIETLEKELLQLEDNLNFEISKSDWEKLNDAAGEKKKLEEEILALYEKISELERKPLD